MQRRKDVRHNRAGSWPLQTAQHEKTRAGVYRRNYRLNKASDVPCIGRSVSRSQVWSARESTSVESCENRGLFASGWDRRDGQALQQFGHALRSRLQRADG
jgi:hypothetical protein